MTHIHYKFSSKLSYDTVVFDGPHITLTDLKRQIMGREKLRAGDCDLQITNAQTKQEYTDDEGLIPKGSSVIVRRIPVSGGKPSSGNKIQNIDRSDAQLHHAFAAVKAMGDQSFSSALPFFSKMANLADADVSEEDKIKVMQNQSNFDCMNYNKKFGSVLPSNYTCYRCGNTGHHIRNCPTSGQDKNFEAPLRIKKSTGIPRSFMVEVDDPSIKGAMLTNSGRYAIPAIDAEAYAIGKKEKPPFVPQAQPKTVEAEEDPVPDELLCLICHDLLIDAVVIPCCGNSYCDDCIRNTLLDSEEHVCPTCSQSNVSPDTLIANKFLRQAVNTFKKERGYSKSALSQNPIPTPSLAKPVSTLPPLTMQSQSQKPQQSTCSQQDSLLHRPQAADTPPPLSGNSPVTTGPASACNTPKISLQTERSCLETPDKEAKGDLAATAAAAVPSVLVSNKESTAAPSQLIPLVNHRTALAEQPQTVGVNQQQSSLGPGQSGPSTCWGSSSSSSGCPTGGWTESQQLTSSTSSSSSSYSVPAPPSVFPSPLFHTYLSAHQSHSSYPPGYPPATPIWTLPCPQGAPIPSLCSSTSNSSIPALIPKEWYRHQRKKKERSPHRGSRYRRSSSRSNSRSSKSKSSRSYSCSSSRSGSRSRSRSQGRSRPRSPYTSHRDTHTHSHPSHSYSYGYKRPRSPTPSSSSSPQVGHRSRSRSSSGHRKNRHHSRHHTKKSASSGSSSKRRGQHSGNEDGGSGASSASSLYAQQAKQANNLDLERERYLQWNKDYKEWCEKYFSSYVSHFHQLPPPFINLPPPPPQWEGSKTHPQAYFDSHYRHPTRTDDRTPPSQSSSDSRSPSSQSSSDSQSTPSQSSSDTRSSPSHTSNNSRSPPSQSSSDGRSTPSEEGAHQQQKDSHPPITLSKDNKEEERQDRSEEEKNVEQHSLKHEQRRRKKHVEREESSTCDATDSTRDRRKNERGHDSGPYTCKDEAAGGDNLKSAQLSLGPEKSLDKDFEKKSRERRNLEAEKEWKRSKDSDSRHNVEKHHKVKPSKEADRVSSDRFNIVKVSNSSSEKNRRRKGDNLERIESARNESSSPDSKKQKTEKKKESQTWTSTEKLPLWEGGITVKPQKKISININLDGKRKEEKSEKQDSVQGKSKEETERTDGGEEQLNIVTEVEVNEKKESIREKEEKMKPDEGEVKQLWEKATFRHDKADMWEKTATGNKDGEKKEDREEEDFYLWHYTLEGVKESENQWGDEGMKTSREDATGKEEEEERERKESPRQEMGELVQNSQIEKAEGELKTKEELMEGVMDDDSSYKDCQERTAVVQTLEDGAAGRDDQLLLIQVPQSRWEMNESEEEQNKGEIKAEEPLPVVLPPTSVTTSSRERDGENGLKRQRSVDRHRDRVMQRGGDREREKNLSLSSFDRSVSPSSGKDRTDSALCAERHRERKMETERWRDRTRERESERPRDRQRESSRSNERSKEDERGRDRARQREHSSLTSDRKKNSPSTSRVSSHWMEQDMERRERQRGGEHNQEKRSSSSRLEGKLSGSGDGARSSISRAAVMPDKHPHKMYGDTLLNSERKDKNHPHDQNNHRYSAGDSKYQGRPAGTHHSSHSQGREREQPPPDSSSPNTSKPRRSSPGQKLSRNESKEEKQEWKQHTGNKVKDERETRDTEAERVRGRHWQDEVDRLSREIKWGGGKEKERPHSSSGSSTSPENSREDDRNEWKRKQQHHRKEKSQVTPEQLEEWELKKHKNKSKRNKDGREEEEEGSGGEVDDRWKAEDDHTKLCSVTFF